jgi:hypothetical protein
MQFDPQLDAPQTIYKLLIGCVVPRPIAWVSSLSADMIPNLAPFSFLWPCVMIPLPWPFPPAAAPDTKKIRCRISSTLYDPNTGRINMHHLHPVGRLAGNLYSHVHDIFEMKRPVENYAG